MAVAPSGGGSSQSNKFLFFLPLPFGCRFITVSTSAWRLRPPGTFVTIDNLQGDYDLQTGRQRGLVLSIPQDRRNPGPDRSEATFDNYAAALIACLDPDDILACHYAATHPTRHQSEQLSATVNRAPHLPSRRDTPFRTREKDRFWEVYVLLSRAERRERSCFERPLKDLFGASGLHPTSGLGRPACLGKGAVYHRRCPASMRRRHPRSRDRIPCRRSAPPPCPLLRPALRAGLSVVNSISNQELLRSRPQ